MKRILTLGLAVLVTTALTSIVLFDHFTGHLPGMAPSVNGIVEAKLYSKLLNEDREIIIRLPRNYDSTKKYPVMYVLDGGSNDEVIAKSFDVLSANNYALATIIVGIPNLSMESRQRDLTPPYLRTDIDNEDSPLGEGDKFLLFMEKELFPFMEKNYPVSPCRLFSGHSRGGLLVMYSLVYKPDLFQGRFCYSTPYWRQDEIIISKVSEFLNSIDTLQTFLYLSVGERETDNMKRGFESMTKLLIEKAPYGFIWHSNHTKKANHQNNAELSVDRAIGSWGQYIKD